MNVWLVARGAGLAALVLLTLATALGALVSGGGPARPGARVIAQYAHRVTASLGLAVLGLHLTMILADSFANVGWVGALVPFTSQYRPLWVGLGSLAAYTFLLVAATGFLRGRMAGSARGAGMWRTLHGAAYVGWAMAILHGLRSGTDSSLGWVRLLYLSCLLVVLGSVATRVVVGTPTARRAVPAGAQR
jgi:methionine sulfoxide reductase heme-binding subunit